MYRRLIIPTVIKGQPSTKEVLKRLKSLDKPVFLSFSCGKDSTAAWFVLREEKIPCIPVYFYLVPGLSFVEAELAYFEDYFGQPIIRYPHPSLYRMLNSNVFQTPERLNVLDDAGMPVPSLDQLWDEIKIDFDMTDVWVADGVRASESLTRRMGMVNHGIMRETTKRVSVIADWLKQEVIDYLDDKGIKPPIDYALWGRSFDGIDFKFMRNLKQYLPDDYERVKRWFPLVELDLLRAETYGF